MGIQMLAILFIFGWVFGIMGPFIYFLNYINWLHIDPLEEEVGMNISWHKGPTYKIEY